MTARYSPNQVVATASTPTSGTSTEVRSGASSTAGSTKRGLELIQFALVANATIRPGATACRPGRLTGT